MKMTWMLPLAVTLLAPFGAHATQRPAITGIAFARFYTTDPAGAEKFYGQTLGFKRTESHGVWTYPVNSSQWVEVLTTPAPPKPNVRMAAVAFTTRNAVQLERYLAEHGVKAEQPLHNGQFAVRDPEGNLVIFVQSGSNKLVAAAKPGPEATSKRVIHVGFIVQDAAKEDAFWRGVLGFTPYWHGGKKDDVTDWQSAQVPDGTDWLEYMLNIPANFTLQNAGVQDHFSLGTAHMADVLAQLQQNHCEGANCGKSSLGRDGKVQVNLYDPDHTRVEFMEFAPSGPVCCSPITGKNPGPEESQ